MALADPPPIVEDNLEGPPGTSLIDFEHPKLRKFRQHGSRIDWKEYLGHGEQGIVFKAAIKDCSNPLVVKVFWRTKRPAPVQRYKGIMHQLEWPFEEECRIVSLIEKMKWAMQQVEEDPKKSQAIYLDRKPNTRHDASELLLAFSDERRHRRHHHQSTEQQQQQQQQQHSTPVPSSPSPPPPFPPITPCHGWITIKKDNLPRVHPPVRKEVDEEVDWHWAIVYDFVPPADHLDVAAGQAHLDFFYATGLTLEAYKWDNWRGGRLVDFGDVCSPLTRYWHRPLPPQDARTWLSPSKSAPPLPGFIVKRTIATDRAIAGPRIKETRKERGRW